MRLHSLGNVTNASRLAAALLLGLALAHDGTALADDTINVSTQGGAAGSSQGELGVQTRAQLSSEDQLDQAESIVRRGNQLAERLSRMLDEARREKDILRANCVNRKLTEANANVRNVEQRQRALRDAAATGDESRRNHEYTVMTVLGQKLDSIDQEASQCLGQSVFEPGASQVITTIPKGIYVGTDPSTVPSTPPPPPAVNVPPDMSGMT